MNRLPKIVIALAIQTVTLILLALSVYVASHIISPPYPYWLLALIQGTIAAYVSPKFGLPPWWRFIQFLLPIGLYLALHLNANPLIYFVILALILLIFSNSFTDRVPLYLSNDTTRQALKELINQQSTRFIDLGSGLGGNVAYMSKQNHVIEATGVETAPLPLLLSKLMSLLHDGKIKAQNLWRTNLNNYNLVYAFLSPEPMPKLWEKVLKEMSADAVFVSNSFAVPGVAPSEIWELADRRETHLYIYRLADYQKI